MCIIGKHNRVISPFQRIISEGTPCRHVLLVMSLITWLEWCLLGFCTINCTFLLFIRFWTHLSFASLELSVQNQETYPSILFQSLHGEIPFPMTCLVTFLWVLHTHLYLLLYLWQCHAACGILVLWPGMELRPSTVKGQSSNHLKCRDHQGMPRVAFLCWAFRGIC